MAEFLPGYEASSWNGLVAPKDTPAEIVDMLNREINAALADPKIKARFIDSAGHRSSARPPSSVRSSPTTPRNGPR